MSSRKIMTQVLDGQKIKQHPIESNQETLDFLSIRLGADTLEIKQLGAGGSARFDFGAKILSRIADGVSANDAASYGQLTDGLALKLDTAVSGAANGVATLDSGGKIPANQLPNSIMDYKGTWNATTNSPSLVSGVGSAGDVYIVNVSGVHDFGDGQGPLTFDLSDWVIYDGSIWQKADLTNAVGSVNGKTGIVTLYTDDISEAGSPTNKWFTDGRAKTAAVVNTLGGSETDQAPSVAAVNAAVSGKANVVHTHVAANVTDFDVAAQTAAVVDQVSGSQTTQAPSVNAVKNALAGKAASSHTHTASQVTDFDAAAKASAVVNTVSGSQTDQAPSVNAIKSYISGQIGGGSLRTVTNKEGGAITVRQVVFMSAAGEVQLAAASGDFGPDTIFGLVYDASIDNDAQGQIRLPDRGDVVGGFSGLTFGQPLYLSRTTKGGYVQSLVGFQAGEEVVRLGKVLSATEIIWSPEHVEEY